MKIEFVEFIPEALEDAVLYISMKYKSARHRCACGCGNVVITPITPTDWHIKYNGQDLTMSPSIGNWHLPCESHYWIVNSEIRWSGKMTKTQIEHGRCVNDVKKKRYFERRRPNRFFLIMNKIYTFFRFAI